MRMRTCAAALLDCDYSAGSAPRDAANLLVEAGNLLDVPEPLGELMKALPAVMSNQQAAELMSVRFDGGRRALKLHRGGAPPAAMSRRAPCALPVAN
jgi:hypothetical protein